MLRYSLKRLLSLVISLVVASLIIFAVIEVAPGDPARFMLGINAQPDTVAAFGPNWASTCRKPSDIWLGSVGCCRGISAFRILTGYRLGK